MLHSTAYFEHLQENPDSLLARIYGIYQVKQAGRKSINFALMANTLHYEDRFILDGNLPRRDELAKIFSLSGVISDSVGQSQASSSQYLK